MTPWVLRIIVANVICYALITLLLGTGDPFLRHKGYLLFEWLSFVPREVLWKPWTIVTYMFLHGGMGHILFNMLGLFFFGPRLEDRLGSKHFLGLYFASGIMGAALSLVFTPGARIIGASGAVFGIFLAFARNWPRERVYIYFLFPIEARVLVVVMTVLALYGGASGGGGVAHFAHLGGFAGGYLYLRWAEWSSPAARFKRRARAPASPVSVDSWKNIRRDDLHPVNREELDRVLAKLEREGPGSLTADEKTFLNRFSGG
jgi:membrane associated rhomboid family serine protease